MRSFLGLAVSLLVTLGSCSEIVVRRCTSQGDCHADSICSMGFCTHDPLPRLRVEASGDRAKVGEVIRFDASQSYLPGGGRLKMELKVVPEDAAELLPPEGDLFSIRMRRPHTSVEASIVARSRGGREVKWTTAIAPQNSPPSVKLDLPETIQPGELLLLEAEVEDADGDPVDVRWSYSGGGHFQAEENRAELDLAADTSDEAHKLTIHASDGIDVSHLSKTFTPENAPPSIEEVVAPETIEHECTEHGCFASAQLQVIAKDVGDLRYNWYLLTEFSGQVLFEGGARADPHLLLQTPPDRSISGPYRLEVHVRDEFDALATATVDILVGNRPPLLQAHDESALDHEYVSEGRYRWYRQPGSVEIWRDPNGDIPMDVKWESPDSRVRFSDAATIDPWVEIEGDESLLGARIPLSVYARDVNGAEASAETEVVLGNRKPELLRFIPGTTNRAGQFGYQTPLTIDVEDADGDPVRTTVYFDPENPPASGYRVSLVQEISGRWRIDSDAQEFRAQVIVALEDSLGGVSLTKHLVDTHAN